MKTNPLETIALEWLDAFNQKKLDQLLALYHEEAIHYSPKLKIAQPDTLGFIQGKASLRNWWQDAFDRLPSLVYRLSTLTANEDRVFMEYSRELINEPNLAVAEVLEIKEGKIIASRVYHG